MLARKYISYIISSIKLNIILILIFLTGCNRVIEWGKATFYQGCKVDDCFAIPRDHIRSVRVYDQFNTLGIFNAMWLSDEVRKFYTKFYAEKYYLSDEAACDLLNKQLEEDRNHLTFYILGFGPSIYQGPLLIRNNKDVPWTVFLKIAGKTYPPCIIKEVELTPEYKLFFGKYVSKFKTVYLVKFDQTLLENYVNSFALCFHHVNAKVALVWDVDENGKLVSSCHKTFCLHENERLDCQICQRCVQLNC